MLTATTYKDKDYKLIADYHPDIITYTIQPLETRLTAITASNLRDTISTMIETAPREVIVKNIRAIKCPCCGAPISKSIDHNCSYCGMYLSLEKEEV